MKRLQMGCAVVALSFGVVSSADDASAKSKAPAAKATVSGKIAGKAVDTKPEAAAVQGKGAANADANQGSKVAGDAATEVERLRKQLMELSGKRTEVRKKLTGMRAAVLEKPEVKAKITALQGEVDAKRAEAAKLQKQARELELQATKLRQEASKKMRDGTLKIHAESAPGISELHAEELRLTKEITGVSVKLRGERRKRYGKRVPGRRYNRSGVQKRNTVSPAGKAGSGESSATKAE